MASAPIRSATARWIASCDRDPPGRTIIEVSKQWTRTPPWSKRSTPRLGVAQIGDGLAGLPADARTQEQLEWLAEAIAEAGGSSTLWRAELTSVAQEQAVIQELAAARSEEYAAIAARARAARLGSSTPAQAVRALRSLRAELRRVQRRDFFPPIDRDLARAEVNALGECVRGEGGPLVAARRSAEPAKCSGTRSAVDS